jgi:hypothetical protein
VGVCWLLFIKVYIQSYSLVVRIHHKEHKPIPAVHKFVFYKKTLQEIYYFLSFVKFLFNFCVVVKKLVLKFLLENRKAGN